LVTPRPVAVTHEAERDHHLESPDFFDAKTFPFIRFESRSIRAGSGGLIADGDLTIRDITKPTTIPFAITSPLGTAPSTIRDSRRPVAW
jgi:polyisoprenoid-binding protein YceI